MQEILLIPSRVSFQGNLNKKGPETSPASPASPAAGGVTGVSQDRDGGDGGITSLARPTRIHAYLTFCQICVRVRP